MKIVIIEDDEKLSKAISGLLVDNGYGTLFALNELEAETILENNFKEIAIAVVDLWMPPKKSSLDHRESGLRLIKLINEKYPSIVSIVHTGHEDLANAVKCMEAGAFSYTGKGEFKLLLPFINRAFEKFNEKIKLKKKQEITERVSENLIRFQDNIENIVDSIRNLSASIQRIQDEINEIQK